MKREAAAGDELQHALDLCSFAALGPAPVSTISMSPLREIVCGAAWLSVSLVRDIDIGLRQRGRRRHRDGEPERPPPAANRARVQRAGQGLALGGEGGVGFPVRPVVTCTVTVAVSGTQISVVQTR